MGRSECCRPNISCLIFSLLSVKMFSIFGQTVCWCGVALHLPVTCLYPIKKYVSMFNFRCIAAIQKTFFTHYFSFNSLYKANPTKAKSNMLLAKPIFSPVWYTFGSNLNSILWFPAGIRIARNT